MNDAIRRWLAGEKAGTPSPTPRPRDRGKRKLNPVVRKVRGYAAFFGRLDSREPRLSSGAVALWCWLWTCERKGHARCTARRLAERFGVAPSTSKRWLAELRTAGFVQTVRRGTPGRSASLVRVRPTPRAPPSTGG